MFYVFIRLYLFIVRGEEREKERERNIDWLLLACPQPGTWPASQACALMRNGTSDPLVCGMMPNPLSHASQGKFLLVCHT